MLTREQIETARVSLTLAKAHGYRYITVDFDALAALVEHAEKSPVTADGVVVAPRRWGYSQLMRNLRLQSQWLRDEARRIAEKRTTTENQ